MVLTTNKIITNVEAIAKHAPACSDGKRDSPRREPAACYNSVFAVANRLIIGKLVCMLIVMGHESSRSGNFLNKLIREFLLSIFRSEALFGHPVEAYKSTVSQPSLKFLSHLSAIAKVEVCLMPLFLRKVFSAGNQFLRKYKAQRKKNPKMSPDDLF